MASVVVVLELLLVLFFVGVGVVGASAADVGVSVGDVGGDG